MGDTDKATGPEAEAQPKSKGIPAHLRVVVRPLPKAVFFYPTWIVSVVAAIIAGSDPGALIGTIRVAVFLFNLLVISFDFSEERTLIAVLGLAVVSLGLLYLGLWATVGSWLETIDPKMNRDFYGLMATAYTVIFLFVWLHSRFDYWEFRPNEVVHRRGVFSKVRRYSTESLRWEKNIPDFLERLLLGAGQLVLTTPSEPFPIVIEHVMRIGRVDDQITDILGVKAVVHTDEH